MRAVCSGNPSSWRYDTIPAAYTGQERLSRDGRKLRRLLQFVTYLSYSPQSEREAASVFSYLSFTAWLRGSLGLRRRI